MRPSGVILTVIFGIIALVVTVWIGRYQAQPPEIVTKLVTLEPAVGPPIAPQGPYPKAVIDETEFNFGVMSMGGEGKHVFTIRNEGEADLELMARKEDTTCSCTVGEISKDGKLPPGKSVDVTLNWKVKLASPTFRHQAIVRTNDPERKEIPLVISGTVEEAIQMSPASPWEMGELAAKGPSTITGFIYTKSMSSLNLSDLKTESGLVKAEIAPMTPEQMETYQAKIGYAITVSAEPTMPVGPFSDVISVKTDYEEIPLLTYRVNGSRPGPFEILGPGYLPDETLLKLGEFPASAGKSTTLSIFVRNFDEELKLLETKAASSIKVEMTKDSKLTGKAQRYLLKVTVPPGNPQNHMRRNAESIELIFNHPEAKAVRLQVEYLSI